MSSTQQFILKLVSLVLGVGLIVAAFMIPGLDGMTRLAIAGGGGVLAGLPITFPGDKPPAAAAALVLALALAPALTSCSPAASTPEARGAEAAQLTRLAYSAAAVTLGELADLHFQLSRTVQTPDQAAVMGPPLRESMKALEAAHFALEQARPYLEPGKDEAEARRFLRDALAQVDVLLPILEALGVKPPKEVVEALGYLRGFLGGAS